MGLFSMVYSSASGSIRNCSILDFNIPERVNGHPKNINCGSCFSMTAFKESGIYNPGPPNPKTVPSWVATTIKPSRMAGVPMMGMPAS